MKGSGARQSGYAAIELVIVAPLLVLMILAVVEFGRVLYLQTLLASAVNQGARYYASQAYLGTGRDPDGVAASQAGDRVRAHLLASGLFPASPVTEVETGIIDVTHVRVSASYAYSYSNPFLSLIGPALVNPLPLHASSTQVILR